ncbi:MAG: tetratricopeptide repeat protein [Planctomycetota bacterium]
MNKSPWLSGKRIYWLVFLLSVIVRLVAISELASEDPAFGYPIVDELTNVDQARGFLAEGPGHGAPYWKPPGYPALLALVALPWHEIGASGQGVPVSYAWVVKILQCILDGVTAILIVAIAGRCCGARAALLAGLLYSIAWMPIYFCGQLLDTTLFTFLVMLSVSLALSASTESRILPWTLVGITIGLAALTRATALPVAVALALAAWFTSGTTSVRIGRSGVVLAGCIVSILPVLAVNLKIGQEPILVSANGGINFYIGNRTGNGIGSDGLTSVAAGPRWDDLLRKSSDIESAAERSRYYYRLTFEEIRAFPLEWIQKMGRKTAALLSARDVPNNKNLIEEKNRSTTLEFLSWLPGTSGPLIAMIIAGLLLGRRGLRQSDLPVVLAMATLALTALAFFMAGRYRVPILALGCIVAGRGIATWGISVKSVVLYLLLLLGVHAIPVPDRSLMESYCIDPVAIGYVHELKQQPEQAAAWYHRSIEQDPDDVRALHNLGHLAQQANRIEEALELFKRATETAPDHSPSWNSLGALLVPIDPLQALACLQQAVKIDHTYAGAWINLGQLLEDKGDLRKALDAYQRARLLQPKRYLATILEARVQLKLQSPRNAERLLQRVESGSLEPGIQALLEEVTNRWQQALEEPSTDSDVPVVPVPDQTGERRQESEGDG